MAKVRDFVYLDVERVRSLVSQLEQGIIDSFSKSLGSTSGIKGGAQGSILGIASGDVSVEQLWRKDSHESRSLHDYIFTKLEDLLVDEDLVREVGVVGDHVWQELRHQLKPTDFLLIEGHVELNDLARMNSLLKRFNEIGRFFVWTSMQSDPSKKKTSSQLKRDLSNPEGGLQIDKELQKGLSLVIENLIGEKILVRSMPFEDASAMGFIGIIDPRWLREEMSTLLFKFGSRPAERWKIFCQVASLIPQSGVPADGKDAYVGIAQGLKGMFDAIRTIDKSVMPYGIDDVTVTPIAVYREAN